MQESIGHYHSFFLMNFDICSLYVKKLSYLCIFKVSCRMFLTINNELPNPTAFFGDAGDVPMLQNESVTFHEALRAP